MSVTDDEPALDALIAREPRNVEALLRKGAVRAAAGDDRGATAFYRAGLNAAAAGGPFPAALRPLVAHAQAGIAAAARRFEDHLEDRLGKAGFAGGRRPPRFQQSLDILTGRAGAEMRLQRPRSYFYPGLPERRYYERSEFDWATSLERATAAIREEMLGLADAGEDTFTPYLVSDPARPPREVHGLVDNPDWSTLYLWRDGGPVEELEGRCRRTLAAMRRLDLPHIATRAPSILFSRLRAGARIPPHHGMINARLVCHLPLIVPPGCGFRVGGETRIWREGELLVFNDTVEHEAWNGGAADRTILIFDIWRPELDPDERQAIAVLFEAIDAYGSAV